MAEDPWAEFRQAPATSQTAPAADEWAEFRAKPVERNPAMGALTASTLGARQGLLANFGDEIMAGLTTPIEMAIGAVKGTDAGKGIGDRISDAYGRGLEQERALVKQGQAEHPAASIVGNVGGGLATGAQMMKGGLTLMKGAPAVLPAAAEGAIYGAVSGAGEGEGLEDRLTKAGFGAAVGGAAGGALGAAGKALAGKNAQAAIPTSAELKANAQAAYKMADDAGLVVKPDGLQSLSAKIKDDLGEFGYLPGLHPKVGVVLNEIDRVAADPNTLKGVELLRRYAGNVRQSADRSEGEIGRKMVNRIDEYLANLSPDQVLTGNAEQGIGALTEARSTYSKAMKSQLLDDIADMAQRQASSTGSGGNVNNAMRQRVNRLLNNPKRSAAFSPDEKDALRLIVEGTPIQNAARLLGKLSPSGNGLMTALGIGATAANPMMGIAPAAGAAAKAFADRGTATNFSKAADLVRSGGAMPEAELTALQRALMEMLTQQSGQQAPVVNR